MTPNQIIGKAKKRVRTNTSNLDWNGFYEDVIDEIFSKKTWKFAKREINYIHPQQTFEYTFNATPDELALNKIASAYYARSYADVGGVIVPTTGSVDHLDYSPYTTFNKYNPDHTLDGYPELLTLIRDNDGTNGMQIGLFRRPVADVAVWIYGDFIPSYTINDNPMPILPKQFHRIVVDGVIHYAAEENGQEKLSIISRKRFELGLSELDDWDRTNPIYKPQFQPYDRSRVRRAPRYPDNY